MRPRFFRCVFASLYEDLFVRPSVRHAFIKNKRIEIIEQESHGGLPGLLFVFLASQEKKEKKKERKKKKEERKKERKKERER